MINFFEYNWQIRDEWFDWCKHLPKEELLKERTGGVGGILYTLFHIIDVEYSWVRGIQGKEDKIVQFAEYNTLEKVQSLSNIFREDIAEFLQTNLDLKGAHVIVPWDESEYTVNEIIHHIIAHEIHHIGQLSIWARELDLSPVPANFIGREFKPVHSY